MNKGIYLCYVCEKVSETMKWCGKCKSVKYCSQECQLSDWPKHKNFCIKYDTKEAVENSRKIILNQHIHTFLGGYAYYISLGGRLSFGSIKKTPGNDIICFLSEIDASTEIKKVKNTYSVVLEYDVNLKNKAFRSVIHVPVTNAKEIYELLPKEWFSPNTNLSILLKNDTPYLCVKENDKEEVIYPL